VQFLYNFNVSPHQSILVTTLHTQTFGNGNSNSDSSNHDITSLPTAYFTNVGKTIADYCSEAYWIWHNWTKFILLLTIFVNRYDMLGNACHAFYVPQFILSTDHDAKKETRKYTVIWLSSHKKLNDLHCYPCN